LKVKWDGERATHVDPFEEGRFGKGKGAELREPVKKEASRGKGILLRGGASAPDESKGGGGEGLWRRGKILYLFFR